MLSVISKTEMLEFIILCITYQVDDGTGVAVPLSAKDVTLAVVDDVIVVTGPVSVTALSIVFVVLIQ